MNVRAQMEWANDEDHGFVALDGEHAWVQEEIHRLAHKEYKARSVVVVWICTANHLDGEPCACGVERYKVKL